MTQSMPSRQPSERITEEVTSWPGVKAGLGRRGEFASPSVAMSSATCTAITRSTGVSRRRSGTSSTTRGGSTTSPSSPASRATPRAGSRPTTTSGDVIAMIRLSYDRAVARHGLPGDADGASADPPGCSRWRRSRSRSRRLWRSVRSCCSAPAGTSSSTARPDSSPRPTRSAASAGSPPLPEPPARGGLRLGLGRRAAVRARGRVRSRSRAATRCGRPSRGATSSTRISR